jgi:heme/copper-type cytochrome/quinol oxidase subunit 2
LTILFLGYVCWFVFAAVWLITANYNETRAPAERQRSWYGTGAIPVVVIRFTLGLMWSAVPAVKEGHQLRTSGPCAITRQIRIEERFMTAEFPRGTRATAGVCRSWCLASAWSPATRTWPAKTGEEGGDEQDRTGGYGMRAAMLKLKW